MYTLQQKLKRRKPTGLLSHASFSLIVSSHHIPLLCCHGPSTVREQHSCRDNKPLHNIARLPGLMHFLAHHVQGHVATQSHAREHAIPPRARQLSTAPPTRFLLRATRLALLLNFLFISSYAVCRHDRLRPLSTRIQLVRQSMATRNASHQPSPPIFLQSRCGSF